MISGQIRNLVLLKLKIKNSFQNSILDCDKVKSNSSSQLDMTYFYIQRYTYGVNNV